MWLIIRKLRSAQFTTNFYKYGWGGQCNSKFKSWWNVMESLSFWQPMPDVPGKVGTSPVCLSRATCRSQSGSWQNQLKPPRAFQSFLQIFSAISGSWWSSTCSALGHLLLSSTCSSSSIRADTPLPPCFHLSPPTQAPSALDAREMPGLGEGHSSLGAEAGESISTKCYFNW